MLEKALGFEIEGSNQYSEAGFKDMKFNQTATDISGDLPEYICDRHQFISDSMKVFASNKSVLDREVKKSEDYRRPYSRRTGRPTEISTSESGSRNAKGTLADDSLVPAKARLNDSTMELDCPTDLDKANAEEHATTIFDRRGGGSTAERDRNLVQRLHAKYWALPKSTTGLQRTMPKDGKASHKALFNSIVKVTSRSLAKFGYQSFNNWMCGRRDKISAGELLWINKFLDYDGREVEVD